MTVENPDEIRLNKYIAHCGITSRRKAAELVKNGDIFINEKRITDPFIPVKSTDKVTYKGKLIKPQKNLVYILMNKPKNTITTLSDEKGRKTVMDIIGNKVKERVYPVGRLDYKTTGLLLLTNDGDLATKLAHPSHRVPKVYQAKLNKELSPQDLVAIRNGFDLDDGPVEVDWIQFAGEDKTLISLEIHMGKNRIVRRIFEHFGYEILTLDRVYYAGLTKKDLPRSWFRHLTEKEVIMLKHFI